AEFAVLGTVLWPVVAPFVTLVVATIPVTPGMMVSAIVVVAIENDDRQPDRKADAGNGAAIAAVEIGEIIGRNPTPHARPAYVTPAVSLHTAIHFHIAAIRDRRQAWVGCARAGTHVEIGRHDRVCGCRGDTGNEDSRGEDGSGHDFAEHGLWPPVLQNAPETASATIRRTDLNGR